MCAKLGGEPWAMDQLPFTSEPTMICAIETFEKLSCPKKEEAETFIG